MRDLLLSLVIGGTVVIGATEMIGVTDILGGQDPSAAVRSAVPELPQLPALPNSLIPDAARTMFSGANAAPDAVATGTPTVGGPPMYIARTGGAGVRARAVCADEAPGQGVALEGTQVTVIRHGGKECPGWDFVTSGRLQFWVRVSFLDASPPRGTPRPVEAKPSPPAHGTDERSTGDDGKRRQSGDTPSPTPEATATATSTPEASPTATAAPRRSSPAPRPTPTEDPGDDES